MPSWSEAKLSACAAESRLGNRKGPQLKANAGETGEREWEQAAVGSERFRIYTYIEENELYSWQTLRL
jgi:hypothetical protein